MNKYIVQYFDKEGRYQGYYIIAPDYQSAIESCKRECKVFTIEGCMNLKFVWAATRQKGWKK